MGRPAAERRFWRLQNPAGGELEITPSSLPLMNRPLIPTAFFGLLCLLAPAAQARVDRVEILSRTDVLDGKPFGDAGPYEKIIGKVYFKVRPRSAHNRVLVDLDKAPRNAAGEVEFSADVYILRPKDPARARGSLLLEIPNRGSKGIIRLFQGAKGSLDPTTEEEFGDGFLLRRGVTLVWIGWQFDVRDEAGLMRLTAPIARGAGGKSITGLLRSDFVVTEKVDQHPLGHLITGSIGGTEYAVADSADPVNVLTVRDSPMAHRRSIPRDQWQFARIADGKIEPDSRSLVLQGGFQPGKIYEVVYRVKDPVVAGLGLAAVRDLASYFKHDTNAVAPAARVYALGISQSGRFLRHFLMQGFNADESGRRAFDGMLIHVAGAGVGSFNHRFAQPSRDAQPTSALFYPTDLFPFADTPQKDPKSGRRSGLLDRARAEGVLPKIFYTNTSYEYWSRAASLIHTSPDGTRDLPSLDDVRVYFLAGLQHFSGPFPPSRGTNPSLLARFPQNPNPMRWYWRALLVNLDEWVANGVTPPPSCHPRLDDGTLVARERLAFPRIPDAAPPERLQLAPRLDFGSQWPPGIITREPPRVGESFPVFLPQVDADGNDRGGVRLPQLVVPLATYTGWNFRDAAAGMPGERISFLGSYFPFAKTKREREQSGDPRLSIEERYRSREDYLERFSAAAAKLRDGRFLLPEDVEPMIRRGGEEWDEVMK